MTNLKVGQICLLLKTLFVRLPQNGTWQEILAFAEFDPYEMWECTHIIARQCVGFSIVATIPKIQQLFVFVSNVWMFVISRRLYRLRHLHSFLHHPATSPLF